MSGLLTAGPPPKVLPAPPGWLVVGTGLIGLAPLLASLLVPRRAGWVTWLGVVGTLVHEAGHAVAAVVTGGGVYTINVDTPDSGLAFTWYRSWLSKVLSSAAGYAAPALVGLGAASLLAQGRVSAVLTVAVVTMVVLLVVCRGLLTVATVLGIGVLSAVSLQWGGPLAQQALAYTLTWLLLFSEIGGLRAIIVNRWHGVGHDDADSLAADTFIPGPVWIAGWAALIGWASWTAVPLLWP